MTQHCCICANSLQLAEPPISHTQAEKNKKDILCGTIPNFVPVTIHSHSAAGCVSILTEEASLPEYLMYNSLTIIYALYQVDLVYLSKTVPFLKR